MSIRKDRGRFALWWLLMAWASFGRGRGTVVYEGNSYRLQVGVHASVPDNPSLLEKAMEAFTEASAFLYNSTGNRFWFSEVTFLLPASWVDRKDYEDYSGQTYDQSEVIIDNIYPEFAPPLTMRSHVGCGVPDPNAVIRFNPSHFLDSESFISNHGALGKVMVHEWFHLRYGIYDEYPMGNQPRFYVDSTNTLVPTMCSSNIPGQQMNSRTGGICSQLDIVNGLLGGDCYFIKDTQAAEEYASIMDAPYLDQVLHFCDSNTTDANLLHNAEAPNNQNRLCNKQSVWEVLRKHQDFLASSAPPLKVDSRPRFRVVRRGENHPAVLVLDTSGSMGGDRLRNLRQGVNFFLSSVVPEGLEVGIVEFDSAAYRLASLQAVTNVSRASLLAAVPVSAGGHTSIGSGVLEGLAVLKDANRTSGALIVVSDGGENSAPSISTVFNDVLGAAVVVHTIAITNAADSNLESLAQATLGASYLTTDSDTSNAITEAFLAIGERLVGDPGSVPVTLYSEARDLGPGVTFTDSVTLDPQLGLDTRFSCDYGNSAGVVFELTSPGGIKYDLSSSECSNDTNFLVITCEFPGETSEVGVWEYTVTSASSSSQPISVAVSSGARDPNDPPIVVRPYWATAQFDGMAMRNDPQRVHAAISKGYAPVLYLMVVAEIESSNGPIISITLLDNGAGADLTKDDGIYSAFFIGITGPIRYSLKVEVLGSSATIVDTQTIVGAQSPVTNTGQRSRRQTSSTGNFQRVSSGGSFQVVNYVSVTYPPAAIMDLLISAVDPALRQVTLQWTAQGAELDVGTASSYEIRYGGSATLQDYDVILGVAVVLGNLTSPSPSGTLETFVIQLGNSDGVFFCAVLSHHNGAMSAASNIVSVTTRALTEADGVAINPPDPASTPGTVAVGLIVGMVLLAVVVFIIILWLVVVKVMNPKPRVQDISRQGDPNV